MKALASTGPAKLPKVSDGQFAELEKELALGPTEHGWEDQWWTLARVRGRRMCGRRRNDRGGAGGLHPVRGRGRVLDAPAACPHLGPTRADTRGAGTGPLLAPLVDRGDVLLPARSTLPADLPAARHRKHRGKGRDTFAWRD
ncbi:hypothetical protein GCM10010276_87210 [Streptomyces longisporus]|uniref:Uncharacterized protein n=1 Tax=Streptomyces longisporus TaxID=1948 RepID=A0ABN3NHT4_STRLO